MTLIKTGPGKAEIRAEPKSFWIYNFDIDGDALKKEHTDFLSKEVVPTLASGGSARIVGLTDRRGSQTYNQALSERRAAKTVEFLKSAASKPFVIKQGTGFGELLAQSQGEADGTDDEDFRAVLVFVSQTPKPPDPPPPPPQPPPPVLVKRITERTWQTVVNVDLSKDGPTANDLITIIGIKELVEAAVAVDEEKPPKTAMLDNSLRVNKTEINKRLKTRSQPGNHVTEIFSTTIKYTWGVPRFGVDVITTEHKEIDGLGDIDTESSTNFPRTDADRMPFIIPPDP